MSDGPQLPLDYGRPSTRPQRPLLAILSVGLGIAGTLLPAMFLLNNFGPIQGDLWLGAHDHLLIASAALAPILGATGIILAMLSGHGAYGKKLGLIAGWVGLTISMSISIIGNTFLCPCAVFDVFLIIGILILRSWNSRTSTD